MLRFVDEAVEGYLTIDELVIRVALKPVGDAGLLADFQWA